MEGRGGALHLGRSCSCAEFAAKWTPGLAAGRAVSCLLPVLRVPTG